ncbi:MAG: hypothetical protein WBQ34_09480 [Candidatus Acidiferrales bacterium]
MSLDALAGKIEDCDLTEQYTEDVECGCIYWFLDLAPATLQLAIKSLVVLNRVSLRFVIAPIGFAVGGPTRAVGAPIKLAVGQFPDLPTG